MGFEASNYSVAMLLLMAFTVAMMIVRSKKPLENNWPFLYWLLVLVVSLRWPDDTWDFRAVLTGAAAGLMLRFEFMNIIFVRLFKFVEVCVQVFMLYTMFIKLFA